MSDEALRTNAFVGAGNVDALCFRCARAGPRALVNVDAAVDRILLVAGRAATLVTALGVDAFPVFAARRADLALVHVCHAGFVNRQAIYDYGN